MTKRLLALVLVCILAIPILSIPVSATSTDTVKIDTTQYNGLINNILSVSEWCKKIYQWAIGFDDELFPILNNNHSELGEWLGTMGADMRDGLLVIGTACVDIYDYLVNVIFESIAIIEDTLVDFAVLTNDWFGVCADWLELTYNEVKNGFTNLFGTYLTAIKTDIGYCKTYLKQLLEGDTSSSDQFNEQISTEVTEFDEAVDSMTEATLPDYEQIDTDFDDYIYNNGYAYISEFFGTFFFNSTLYVSA